MDGKIRFLIDFIGYTHGQIIDAPTDQMQIWARTKAKHQGKQICCFSGEPEDRFHFEEIKKEKNPTEKKIKKSPSIHIKQ